MLEIIAAIFIPTVLVVALARATAREDARLRRRARRYRQLEHEGIEQIGRDDPFPEERAVEGGFLREPDGGRADADHVLREELRRAREHMTRREKGAQCLL